MFKPVSNDSLLLVVAAAVVVAAVVVVAVAVVAAAVELRYESFPPLQLPFEHAENKTFVVQGAIHE